MPDTLLPCVLLAMKIMCSNHTSSMQDTTSKKDSEHNNNGESLVRKTWIVA